MNGDDAQGCGAGDLCGVRRTWRYQDRVTGLDKEGAAASII
jgi:hypothetical protein